MEMHYGSGYGGEGSVEEDRALVEQVNAVRATLQKYFTGPTGYIGCIAKNIMIAATCMFQLTLPFDNYSMPCYYLCRYVDYELAHPGAPYFGPANTAVLSAVRSRRDPTGVVSSAASTVNICFRAQETLKATALAYV